jgi:hypothetical protein
MKSVMTVLKNMYGHDHTGHKIQSLNKGILYIAQEMIMVCLPCIFYSVEQWLCTVACLRNLWVYLSFAGGILRIED